MTSQGKDGDHGYPGLQGPPGEKVQSSFIHHVSHADYFNITAFNALTLNIYCVLKQGEPGMGEKGERGMDGLPGLKVEDRSETALTQYAHQ